MGIKFQKFPNLKLSFIESKEKFQKFFKFQKLLHITMTLSRLWLPTGKISLTKNFSVICVYRWLNTRVRLEHFSKISILFTRRKISSRTNLFNWLKINLNPVSFRFFPFHGNAAFYLARIRFGIRNLDEIYIHKILFFSLF